jgi:hypothetical protein
VAVVGRRVLGYLPGYLKEEHYSSGGRFLLLGMLGLPAHLLAPLAVGILVAAGAWILWSGTPPEAGTAALLTLLVLLTSPVQPWYAVGLAALGGLAGAGGWVLVAPALLGELYYAAVILDDPHQVAVGRLTYGTALVVLLAVMAGRHIRTSRLVLTSVDSLAILPVKEDGHAQTQAHRR